MGHATAKCPRRPAHRRRVVATLALSSLLPAGVGATPQGPPFATRVRFANYTAHRRAEWGLATVPFPLGVWMPGESFTVPGGACALLPFGARWPDGSTRYAQLLVALDLAPGEERIVQVVEGPPLTPPFALSTWVQRGLPNFDLDLVASVGTLGVRTATLQLVRFQELNAVRAIALLRGRIPETDIVCDVWVSLLSGQDHAPFELRVTCSSAESRRWSNNIDSLDLWVRGAVPFVRGPARRGISYGPLSSNGPNGVRLLGSSRFYDGQGQEWTGDLLFCHPTGAAGEARRASTLMAVMEHPLYGVSTDWASSRAFGPFGYVPPPPPWIVDGGRAASTAQRLAFNQWRQGAGGPWDDLPMGLLPNPGAPGDQPDFGAAKLLQIFASGLPDGIEEARFNVGEEACRPVHHREGDGNPVIAGQHARWVTWDGRTHFNQLVSPDRLNKPFPSPYPAANGWLGRDDEHWSSLTLVSAYLLTRSPSLLYELDNEAELFLAGQTVPSIKPGLPTNTIFAARAVGRTMLSLSWNYLVTGRADVRRRLAERAREVVAPQALGFHVQGPVRPILAVAPDPRLLMRDHWRPWEEAQAVLGLEACYRVTGEGAARAVAVMAARSLVTFGWLMTPTENIVASAIGWKTNGASLTAQQYLDPTWTVWSYGTGFNEWSVPALKMAMLYGLTYGDPNLFVRASWSYAALHRLRTAPLPFRGWDRFSEWDAVQ